MKKVLLALLLLFSSTLLAQYPDWISLSKTGSLNSIAEDGNYIWVSSCIGAMKIDKNTGQKTYFDKTNSPLPDSWISEIAVDKNGNKWLGTWIKGCLLKFDDVNWTIYDTSNSLLPGHAISGLAIDSSNNVWISTGYNTDGLLKFDGTTWTVYNTSNSGIPSNYISDIFCEGNTVWVGTNAGLAKFNGINWIIYNPSNSTITDKAIIEIEKDTQGNIWLLHYNGLEKFDGSAFNVFDNSNTNIQNINNYSMTIDNNNIIWTGCGSYNLSPHVLGGIMSFDGTAWTKYDTTNSSLTDVDVSPVYADNSNYIWFGCCNTGRVGKKSASVYAYYDPSNSELGNSYVRQIVFGQNRDTYIGTQESYASGNGLVKYNWNTWTDLSNYNTNSFRIASDLSGNLYVKNRTGLQKFDGSGWSTIPDTPALQTYYPVPLYLTSLVTDSSGGIWMDYVDRVTMDYDSLYGTWYYNAHEGLANYNGSSWMTFTNLNSPFPDGGVNDIKVDADNHIWVGTGSGLVKYDGSNWTTYNTSNSSIPINYINSFTIDTTGNIWFSNGESGFYKFDQINTVNYTNPSPCMNFSDGDLSTDVDGSIWEKNGFNLIHFDGSDWTTFNRDNSPIPDLGNVTALSIDKYGNKWLGTQFGVLVYKEGGVITLSDSGFPDLTLSVYPNPFREAFEMDFSRQLKDVEITLYNALSQPVYLKKHSQAQKIRIPRKQLSPGIYSYQVKSGNEIISTGKVIAE